MKILAIIPARSGSRGLKDKNIKPLCGIPLCAYTIKAALKSGAFDEIHFSTDSQKYADIAMSYGASVPFLRQNELATDAASSWDVVKDVIKKYRACGREFDAAMLLQPTVPFRSSEDISNCVKLMQERSAEAIVSVTEPEHSPYWCAELPEDGNMRIYHEKIRYLIGRQQLKKQYILNGAIYLFKVEHLFASESIYEHDCYAYIMPQKRSIDIDNQDDFDLCEYFLMRKDTRD